ncbi:hypothetical protein LEP1GSC016_3109 [Leptospira borgpetersenii serovar Hardjo-bovis str. Sponselee]|uniref:Uncharacterized protein n=1 Tax=Leptospira borgpetersenii serovar Hardjo-bovis str. Sponselee TaxID=1303729 RepID=M6BVL5_LEPBO|nr:hypothetical protein LBK6_02000 [Leptospira borgpetersenii serovar Hardjo]AWV69114.1 hypothetical protein B9T54_02145 [Leptospira borgpetersenii serovar Hardjo-bovis]EMJ77880.1 hypothetical protein LEP1GSC016_3109 [Leptospira borgpetersenii serovar Hardjo-bovis str. Sponselee]TQE52383.1 hypothetical protein FFZ95_10870 [Leptospira borgpetersenii]AMX60442.1 hypothetical protein LBK9_01995 [Leptospira borgpetersenii serovar Hardjo]
MRFSNRFVGTPTLNRVRVRYFDNIGQNRVGLRRKILESFLKIDLKLVFLFSWIFKDIGCKILILS